MSEFPFGYKIIPIISWTYLSSLLMIALYFKFNRFWSVRNLDLLLIILLAPGLLMVSTGVKQQNRVKSEASDLARIKFESGVGIDTASAKEGTATEIASTTDGNGRNEPSGVPAAVLGSAESIGESAGLSPSNLAAYGKAQLLERNGFIALFLIAGLFALRMLIDPMMVRRPKLEPNLSFGGLTFLGGSLLLFLILNVIGSQPTTEDLYGFRTARNMLERTATNTTASEQQKYGPGYGLVFLLPTIPTFVADYQLTDTLPTEADENVQQTTATVSSTVTNSTSVKLGSANSEIAEGQTVTGPGISGMVTVAAIRDTSLTLSSAQTISNETILTFTSRTPYAVTAKIMAIACQLALIAGIFYIGYVHFDDARMGIGIATLYLMLPYTAEMTGRVIHILPAALLIWAIAFYRRPWLSGVFVGLAMGVFYYPLFLLPLWLSFYWRRGRWRFLGGVVSMLVTLAFSLLFVSQDLNGYISNLSGMFGVWTPRMDGLQGIWGLGWDSVYRLPILACFVALSIAFALWPAQKNLGTLICCSCALMAFVQFWHGYGGGLLMGWYLPLGLLAIFRPNLDDRVALTVLSKGKKRAKSEGDLRPAA